MVRCPYRAAWLVGGPRGSAGRKRLEGGRLAGERAVLRTVAAAVSGMIAIISVKLEWREDGLVRGGNTYTTEAVILLIVAWFLDRISANDGRIPVIVVGFISCEINLSK